VNVSYAAKMPQTLPIAFCCVDRVQTAAHALAYAALFASKNRGDALLLANPLGRVNSRQKGKLANSLRFLSGDGNSKAKRMSRLLVRIAIPNKHIILAGGNFGWRCDVFHSWGWHY
jgi:hypothetical protein